MFSQAFVHLRHFFTPFHSNNYRARFLHRGYFIFYLALLLIIQTGSSYVQRTHPDILGYATDISVEKIVELVNIKRKEYGLAPLSISSELSVAATAKAADMYKNNYWSHISPSGNTPWEFITGSGYQYIYAGENLAKNFDTSSQVINAWMNSPTHRANILKPEYREIGIAVMNGKLLGDETTLVVQEFGSRAVTDSLLTENRQIKVAETKSPAVVEEKTISASPRLGISKKASLYIAEFLLAVLCIDALFMYKNRTNRLSGHTIAHIIFFLALLGAMGATGIGVIL